jgi:(R,R)-butanediol dehydrogenase/meso-butanediol dehydrogenase/diacetyl reductase
VQVALVTGRHEISLRDFPEPAAAPGKAVVEIAYCGICGTDVHAWASGAPYNPAICGHEWAGTVRARGPGVHRVKDGDRVAIGIASACGACDACRAGHADYCAIAFAGLLGTGAMAAPHGGFARSIAIDATRLVAVAAHLSDVEAAMLEPATVALHAVRRAAPRLGDASVVIGAGPIGLLTLQCARAAGAGCVVVVEPHAARRARASTLGAHAVIDPAAAPIAEQVKAIVGPLGADIVFECAGVPQTIEQSATLVRRGGTVALVGLANSAATITPATWLVNEVRLVAALGYLHEEFDMTMALVADGRLALAPMHTSTLALRDIGRGFTALSSSVDEVKILVNPREGA